MPISSHLLRKLQQSLGMDAAADLANVLETMDAIRADLAELRHEFDLMKARIDTTATKADLLETQGSNSRSRDKSGAPRVAR